MFFGKVLVSNKGGVAYNSIKPLALRQHFLTMSKEIPYMKMSFDQRNIQCL